MTEDESQPLEATDAEESESGEADLKHYRWRIAKNLTRRVDQYLVDKYFKGRSAIGEMILGSTASKVLQLSDTPVLLHK